MISNIEMTENQEADSAGPTLPGRAVVGETTDQAGEAPSGSTSRKSRKGNVSSKRSRKFSRIRITGDLLHRLRLGDGEALDEGDALPQELLGYPATPLADVHTNISRSVEAAPKASSTFASISDIHNTRREASKSSGPGVMPSCGGTSSEDEGISDPYSSLSSSGMKSSERDSSREPQGENPSSASLQWDFEEPSKGFTQDNHICSSDGGLLPSSLDLDVPLDIQEDDEPTSSSSSTSSDSGAGVSPDPVTEEGAISAVTQCFSWLDGEIFALEPQCGPPEVEASTSPEEERVRINQRLQCDGRDCGKARASDAPQERSYEDADGWEVDEDFEFTRHSSVEISQDEVEGVATGGELDDYIDECFEWFDGVCSDGCDTGNDTPTSQDMNGADRGDLIDTECLMWKEQDVERHIIEIKELHRLGPSHGSQEGEAEEVEEESTALGQAGRKSEALLVCDSDCTNVSGCRRPPRVADDTQQSGTAGTGNQNYDCGLRTWLDTTDVGKEGNSESFSRCGEGCGENVDADSHGSLSESDWSDAVTCILRESYTQRDSDTRASDSDWDDSDVSSEDAGSDAQQHYELREFDDFWEGHGLSAGLLDSHRTVSAAYPAVDLTDSRFSRSSGHDSSSELRESYISTPLHSGNLREDGFASPIHCGNWTEDLVSSPVHCGNWTEDPVSSVHSHNWSEGPVSSVHSHNWSEDPVSSPVHSGNWTEDAPLKCDSYRGLGRDIAVPHVSGSCLGCLMERVKDGQTAAWGAVENGRRRSGGKGFPDKYCRSYSHDDDGWIDCENRRWYRVENRSLLARNSGSQYEDVIGMYKKHERQMQQPLGMHNERMCTDENENIGCLENQRRLVDLPRVSPWNRNEMGNKCPPSGLSCASRRYYQTPTLCHPWMPAGESCWYNDRRCCIRPEIALQNKPSCENNFNSKNEGYSTNHLNDCGSKDQLHCKYDSECDNSFIPGESVYVSRQENPRNHSGSECSDDAYDTDIGEDSDTDDSLHSNTSNKNGESCVSLAGQTNDSLDLLSQYRGERERRDHNRRRSRVKHGGGSHLGCSPTDGRAADVNVPNALTNEQIAHMQRKNGSMRGRSYIFLRPLNDMEDEDNTGTNEVSLHHREPKRSLPNYRHDAPRDVSSPISATRLHSRATPSQLITHGDASSRNSLTYSSSSATDKVKSIHKVLLEETQMTDPQPRESETATNRENMNVRYEATLSEMTRAGDTSCLGGPRQRGPDQRSGMAYGSTNVYEKNKTSNGFRGGSVLDGAFSGVFVHSITDAAASNSTVSDFDYTEGNSCRERRHRQRKLNIIPQSDAVPPPGVQEECTCLPGVLVGPGGRWGASGQQCDGHRRGHPDAPGRVQHPDTGAGWPSTHPYALPSAIPPGSRVLQPSIASYLRGGNTARTEIPAARAHVTTFGNDSTGLGYGEWRLWPLQTLSTTCQPPTDTARGTTGWDGTAECSRERGNATGREGHFLTTFDDSGASGESSKDRFWSSVKFGYNATGKPSESESERTTNERTLTSVYLGNRPISSTGLERSDAGRSSPASQQRRLFIPASCLTHSLCTRYPLYKKIQDVLCRNTTGLKTEALPQAPDAPVQIQPRSLLQSDLIGGGDTQYKVKGHWENKINAYSTVDQRVIDHCREPHPSREADVGGGDPGWTLTGQVGGPASSTCGEPHPGGGTAHLAHREPPDGTANPAAPVGRFLQKLSEMLPFSTHTNEDECKLYSYKEITDSVPTHKMYTVENSTRSMHKNLWNPEPCDTTAKKSDPVPETRPVLYSTIHDPLLESHEHHLTPHSHTSPSLSPKPQVGSTLITIEPQVNLAFTCQPNISQPSITAQLDKNILPSGSNPERDRVWSNISPCIMSQSSEKYSNTPEPTSAQVPPKNLLFVEPVNNLLPTDSELCDSSSSTHRPQENPLITTIEHHMPSTHTPLENQSSLPEPHENPTYPAPELLKPLSHTHKAQRNPPCFISEPPSSSHSQNPTLVNRKPQENPPSTSPGPHNRLPPTQKAQEKSLSPVGEPHKPPPPTHEPQVNSPSAVLALEENLLPSPTSGSRPAKSIIPESAHQQSSILLVVDPPTATADGPSLVDLMKLGSYDGYITLPVAFSPARVPGLSEGSPPSHEKSSQCEMSESTREVEKECDPDVSISTQVRVSLKKYSRRRKNGSRKLIIKFTLCLGK